MIQASENDYTKHYIVTGNAEIISAQTPIVVGNVPVFITWQDGGTLSMQIFKK